MRAPDKEGRHGRAWAAELPPTGQRKRPDQDGCLAQWLVFAPQSHPIWPYKVISAIHLRDIEGVKPAYKSYPEAQYELSILSIDPEKCPEPDPDKILEGFPVLRPADVILQFHDVKDEQVVMMMHWAVDAIVHGHLVPDQDYRSHWAEAVSMTVSHIVQGKHATA